MDNINHNGQQIIKNFRSDSPISHRTLRTKTGFVSCFSVDTGNQLRKYFACDALSVKYTEISYKDFQDLEKDNKGIVLY